MNKTFKTILILSLAANALWLLAAASGYFSLRKPTDANTSARALASAPASASAPALSPETSKEIAALLSTNDLAALRDQLRALGLPEDLTRSILEERIASVVTTRMREFAAEKALLPTFVWVAG